MDTTSLLRKARPVLVRASCVRARKQPLVLFWLQCASAFLKDPDHKGGQQKRYQNHKDDGQMAFDIEHRSYVGQTKLGI